MKSNLKSARTTHTTQAHRTEVKVMAGKGVGGGVGMGGGGGVSDNHLSAMSPSF